MVVYSCNLSTQEAEEDNKFETNLGFIPSSRLGRGREGKGKGRGRKGREGRRN
jgi:hypothetical protein